MSAAVLWTAGKDSALALYRAARLDVTELVTFVPPNADFRAHNLRSMAAKARAAGLPHHRHVVIEPPFDAGYERAFRELRASGINRVVGDIAAIGGQPNFINAPAKRVHRRAHLEQIIALGFDVLLTYVNEPWLGPEWVGRHLDEQEWGIPFDGARRTRLAARAPRRRQDGQRSACASPGNSEHRRVRDAH
ncbi:MAG: hypothetical protein K0R38_2663 [Polyangiaceae bacterium]|jgi:diphthamide synthase (EF-2-diphthine--ammonia ligase)|nr:hypothetical protein [Polyangiaceae bacterium]